MKKNNQDNPQESHNKSTEKNFIAIFGSNALECVQLIFWGWVRNLKMLIILPGIPSNLRNTLEHILFIKKYLKESIREHKAVLGNHKGLWYEANEEAIDLTLKFYEHHLRDKSKSIRYYKSILNTEKFEAYVKKRISGHIFALLMDLHTIRLTNLRQNPILINRNPINSFVVKHMEEKYEINYKIRWVLSRWKVLNLCVYYGWLFKQFFSRGITLNKRRKIYKISKEATWDFHGRTLRDDILIDNGQFELNDILMLEFSPQDPLRAKAFKEAIKRGFATASLPKLKININKNFWGFLFFYFIVPLRTFFQCIKKESYLLPHIFSFHRGCLPVEVLMNSYNIKYNLSIVDIDDIATTIILNKYGAKNVIFHWSDLTSYKAYDQAFIAHNIYFVWGDIQYDYHSATRFIDKKVKIGCIYKKEYNLAVENKESIITQIDGFERGRKTVTFCDTAFSDSFVYTELFFLEYFELIKEYCERNTEVNVLLKPKKGEEAVLMLLKDKKSLYKKIRNELFSFVNFIYLDPFQWKIEDVLAISDVCVSMGMNSPSTIAILCGNNGLYFDNTGNIYHPFSKKYKNIITFEDKDRLYEQINNILNARFDCRDVISKTEIKEYDDIPDDNALERLRDRLYKLTS